MKNYVLIDGENFVHRVASVLQDNSLIRTRQSLKKLEVYNLVTSFGMTPDVCNYYTTKIRVPKINNSFYKRIERMRKWNGQWIPYLANQGVTTVKAGLLRIRSSKTCAHCGKKTDVLQEKGVDVRLGVDIVSFAGKDRTIYVVSSDTDIIPAIVNAKNKGAKVVYVAIEGSEIDAIAKSASLMEVIKIKDILKSYKKVNP